ncbi:hypothetical protein LCGC14_1218010 [marine sediment metagenome]|uniref:Uncharacterized protein n=1 Tax=marine sediment metagenome TaxID=412755 RepID=A0A0F9LZD6_9ZZZZ
MAKKKLRQLTWAIRVRAVCGFDEHFERWTDGTAQTWKTRKEAAGFKRSCMGHPSYKKRMAIVRVELREV